MDLPLLKAIAAATADCRETSLHDLVLATGFSFDETAWSLEDLADAGFIEARFNRGDDRIIAANGIRLLEKGRRATGVWPPEQMYQALLDALEQMIEEEPDPVQKSKLQKLRDAAASVGADIVSNLVVSLGMRAAGL